MTFGSTTLNLSAYAGAGTVSNAGNKTINGQTTLQLVMHGVANTQQTWAAVQQISGGSWQWFRTRIKFPDIVITRVCWGTDYRTIVSGPPPLTAALDMQGPIN